jgi:hypothetical protein
MGLHALLPGRMDSHGRRVWHCRRGWSYRVSEKSTTRTREKELALLGKTGTIDASDLNKLPAN